MIRRKLNLTQEIPDLILIANMHCRQFRIADNRVHRCADIVAHIVEEHRFSLGCRLRHFKGTFKSDLLLHFLAIDGIVVENTHKHAMGHGPIAHFRHLHAIPQNLVGYHATVIRVERIFMLQAGKNRFSV